MQLTRFDRWLREKFVYRTHILTMRPPAKLPRGVRSVDLPDQAGRRFKHEYIANSKPAGMLINQLREDGQMYSTEVVDRKAWYVPLVAPKDKSVTWRVISFVIISSSLIAIGSYLRPLVNDPEFRQNLSEAIEIMKG